MNQLAETLAVATSIPALFLCGLVLIHWFPEARRAFWERRDAADWLVLGVSVSFTGMLLATLYWSLFWTLTRLDQPSAAWFSDHGALFNLFTRQTAVIAAAWCHLKAYHAHARAKTKDPAFHLKWTLAMGALVALSLSIIGGLYRG